MEDIIFPSWMKSTATLAMAAGLGHILRRQYSEGVHGSNENNTTHVALLNGEADEDPASDVNDSDTDYSEASYNDFSNHHCNSGKEKLFATSTATAVRLLFGKDAGSGAGRRTLVHSLGGEKDARQDTPQDLFDHPRVKQLFRTSNLERLSAQSAATVTHKDAVGILGLMALAVGVKDVPAQHTKEFFNHLSKLVMDFLKNLPTLTFSAGVDVSGFVATLTACTLKLRSAPRLTEKKDGEAEEVGVGLEHRVVDPVLLESIPEDLDACVKSPVAIGVLEGLSLTHRKDPVHMGHALVQHLHDLADDFAASPQRREVLYKRLLCLLLEGLSCSLVVDYERANSWVTAIIQPDYVRKGLFQREVLHARVVSSTLLLLIRQYQELAKAYIRGDCASGKALPDFVEGDELIETVWGALQTATVMWTDPESSPSKEAEGFITASPSPQNVEVDGAHAADGKSKSKKLSHLYAQNLKTVVVNLLRTEVERLRCYYAMTSKKQQLAEQQASGGADATNEDPAVRYYFPSEEEESLRVKMAANIVNFLLLPTSVMKVLPLKDAAAGHLRASLSEYCAQALSIAPSNQFLNHAAGLLEEEEDTETEDSKSGEAPLAVFSNHYYHRMEQLLRELINTIVHRNTTDLNTNEKQNDEEENQRKSNTSSQLEDALTALCIENLSIADPHLVSFASSEVMDTVVQLTSKSSFMARDQAVEPTVEEEGEAPANPKNNKKMAEDNATNTYRLSICLNILSEIVVPQRYSILNLVGLRDLARFGQLLCDNYEDSLREILLKSKSETLSDVFRRESIPSSTMRVAAEGFYKLIVRVHERIISIAKDALDYVPAKSPEGSGSSGDSQLKKERHRYVRVLNREGESIRLLTKTALKCVLNICFPGSGIIYQKKSGGTRPADGSTAPVGMSPLAKACISPLLPSLCLLFQLNSLFPIHHVGHLQHHVEYGAHLLAEDMSDQYIVHYYFQPSKLSFHYEKEEISNLFRSFWLMISFYGFAKEALDISTQKLMVAKGQAASHNATAESTETKKDEGTIVKGESTLLTEREAKQIRLLATSAPPLLRMCSSEMHQALADIVVLLRYADIRGDPTSRKGIFHHAISSHLSRLFKGAAEHASTELLELHSSSRCKKWLKKLNTSELYLVQALAELELLRASSGSIANLTVYNHFEIREFVASPQVKNVLLEVVGAVCAQYMTSLLTLPPGLAPRLVAKDIHQLLLMFSFSIDSVRQAARLMLEMVITSFPAYSVYAGELPLLWTVIDLVDGGTDADLERLCLRLHYQETPAISPDRDSIERQMHLQEMVQLAESWVVHGRQAAPVELFSLATRFVLYQETVKGGTSSPLMGTRLASLAAQPYDEERQSEQSGSGVLSLSEPSKASYAGALVKFSGAQGQVLSALRLESFASVEERILSQLLTAVRFGRSKATISTVNHFRIRLRRLWQAVEGSDSVQSGKELVKQMDSEVAQDDVPRGQLFEFESALGSAVALLTTNLTSPSISVKLLRYVVQAPLILFHKDYIQRAVQSWRWFLSPDRERYSLWMLQQIVEGVEFTIAHKLGLFDGLQPSQADQVQSGDFSGARRIENTYPRDYDVHSPHSLVIAFLAEEYVNPGCASSQDSVHLRYLYELASRMVAVPEQWSLKDSSFAETMRASSFLLHVCRAIQLNNGRRSRARLPLSVPYTSLGVLRQRLYTCLLRWFRQDPPRWYFARQPTLALQQVNMLTELIHVLRDEHNSVRRSTLGFADLYFPVANRTQESIAAQNKVQSQMSGILALLRTLVEHELLRIRVWQNPRRTLEIPQMSPVGSWASHVQSATENDPAVAIALVSRFPAVKAVRELVSEAVVKTPSIFADIPGAVDLYLTEEVLARGAPHLHLFTNCSIVQALRLLDKRYVHFNGIPKYAIRSLLSQKSEYLIFYLPQLLQVLATDESGDIEDFLYRTSHKSTMFCHQLLWALQTEGEGTNELAKRCSHLEERIKSRMTPDELLFYQSEFAFTDLVTSLSGELMKFDKPLRKPNLRQRLRDDEFHDGPAQAHVYLPTDIGFRITDVIPHTAGAMQSAAKCPILVQFKCVPREPEDRRTPPEMTEEEQQIVPVVKGCIFKMGDDCRQDQLSLQLMELFRRVLDSVGVPSYLYPYRVVTTGRESGIIECVPNAQSRNEIGKLVETNLAEFFVQTFGHPESVGFKRARANFIQSTAAYSIVSFILNIKDRHNGNIMIDNKGNLVHIDFGFLFDTSPGGDMNFESSPFKLTTEMVQLIGKDVGSDSKLLHSSKALSKALVDEDNYVYFKVLVNRIYLAVRQYGREICLLVELMLRSGLPCFKPKKTIKDLAERLALDKDEVTAADYMRKRIHEARQNYRTVLYDHYQRIAEGIAM